MPYLVFTFHTVKYLIITSPESTSRAPSHSDVLVAAVVCFFCRVSDSLSYFYFFGNGKWTWINVARVPHFYSTITTRYTRQKDTEKNEFETTRRYTEAFRAWHITRWKHYFIIYWLSSARMKATGISLSTWKLFIARGSFGNVRCHRRTIIRCHKTAHSAQYLRDIRQDGHMSRFNELTSITACLYLSRKAPRFHWWRSQDSLFCLRRVFDQILLRSIEVCLRLIADKYWIA